MTQSPTDFASCPHDRGPGISVCLRCRADAHRKAADSRRRVVTRVVMGVVVVLVVVVGANSALAARGTLVSGGSASPRPAPPERFQVAQAGSAETPRLAQSSGMAAPAPVIDAGRTDLSSGRFAERSAEGITVHFDTPVFRTRHQEKFEQVVRGTLPAVYGAFADSALASIPPGDLAATGDLLSELPLRGVPLPARAGWRLIIWPGTRPGHDGPLVVSYRVTVARAQ